MNTRSSLYIIGETSASVFFPRWLPAKRLSAIIAFMKGKAILYAADTEGIADFAVYLVKKEWEVISAGHTGVLLSGNGIPFKENPALSEAPRTFQEYMSLFTSVACASEAGAEGENDRGIGVVCVNLLPKFSELHDFLDMDTSPAGIEMRALWLVLAACKNFKNVLVLTDPADYHETIIRMDTDSVSEKFRLKLAGKAFNMASACAASVSESILLPMGESLFPNYFSLAYKKKADVPIGGSTTQTASLYTRAAYGGSMGSLKKLQGKDILFRSYIDINAVSRSIGFFAARMRNADPVEGKDVNGNTSVAQFTPTTGTVFAISVKHGVPVSAALGGNAAEAFRKMYNCGKDSLEDAAAGFSSVVDEAAAKEIARAALAVVVAPGFTADARAALAVKRELRLVSPSVMSSDRFNFRSLDGALLAESSDTTLFGKWQFVTNSRPRQKQLDEMSFGQFIVMNAKEDAAVVIKDMTTTGMCCCALMSADACYAALDHSSRNIGLGLTSDTSSAEVLVSGSPLAFDWKLCETIANRGVRAILQPGGSKSDGEFANFCDQRGIAMVFTGIRRSAF